MKNRIATWFISHGGGPLPLLGDAAHQPMVDCLQAMARQATPPSAILVISAHWETVHARVTSAAQPGLIYDYFGFPEASYQIEYPCPGSPLLAEKICACLQAKGIDCQPDAERGLDHGVFVPLKLLYPAANIPCVQLSLLKSLDPTQHIRMGEALRDLDIDNLLVIGSGFSFHNLRAFFSDADEASSAMNQAFEHWLVETCSSTQLNENQRRARLIYWGEAPHARFCHPREEHLLPLHVCYGLMQSPCRQYFQLPILNKQSSMYLW